jgi:hypothetical protein
MKKYLITLLLIVSSQFFLSAQGPSGPGGPPSTGNEVGNETNSTDVPLDGGSLLLLAAGAAFGAKKLRDKKKKEPTSEI